MRTPNCDIVVLGRRVLIVRHHVAHARYRTLRGTAAHAIRPGERKLGFAGSEERYDSIRPCFATATRHAAAQPGILIKRRRVACDDKLKFSRALTERNVRNDRHLECDVAEAFLLENFRQACFYACCGCSSLLTVKPRIDADRKRNELGPVICIWNRVTPSTNISLIVCGLMKSWRRRC